MFPASSQVWMSHSDTIKELPEGFEILGTTESIPVAAFKKTTDNGHTDNDNEQPLIRFTISSRSISFCRRQNHNKKFFGKYLRLLARTGHQHILLPILLKHLKNKLEIKK